MTTIIIAIVWLGMASLTALISILAVRETRNAPGIVEFVRAAFIGSLVDCLLATVVIVGFFPQLITNPPPLTFRGILLSLAFFSRTLPMLLLELRLLQKTEWLQRHTMADLQNGGPAPLRVMSNGPVPLSAGTPVIVKVKRLSTSKTFWIGLITVVIAAAQMFGELPELAPYRDEMLALAGVLMVVMRVITNQPVNLR